VSHSLQSLVAWTFGEFSQRFVTPEMDFAMQRSSISAKFCRFCRGHHAKILVVVELSNWDFESCITPLSI
jgi:hypothetical protein